ncbi:ABC transporter permease [Mesorhizobium sp. M1060]|uniref:ABC transporter permease n=1 Tax=unclassified Mesorhizobium TaxID=325217 RepID=UPI0003CED51B|nr:MULTISPECIES: ABC transporter permease [unclassified Mesorhizobium]ESX41082.1 ABC transporter permease [Mesorhizobium sp. LSHC426A00]ESX45652.1 ABC transporter permease [Mesorhizobium sp. LSHC424B00]ESX64574.1 ABC transporter permease [Mesorhizobium sp. LSHC416B00]ESZ02698.1 ABC transporter permease [Mesorhizobium sp. L2C089B000]WJI50618.1 ABC transporter permease [Mesorhizobium sp. C089B]
MDFAFFAEILPKLLAGLPLTLELAGTSILLGAILALALALAQRLRQPLIDGPIKGFVAVFRGTPLLVQIFLIYYGLGQFRPTLQELGLWGLFREPYWCAILALTLNTAAYGSEILRGAMQSVPSGQIEAAQAFGMTRLMTLRRIVLPIALRQALPSYGNEIILMVKGTSLASIVTLMEITGIAQGIISQTYRAMEVFVCAGAIYLILNFIITRTLGRLEYNLSRHLRPASGLATSPA